MGQPESQCFRCGRAIAPGEGREATYEGERVMKHKGCETFFRGTRIHHKHAPMIFAPVETYAHTFAPGDSLLFMVTNLRWRAIHTPMPIIRAGLRDIDLAQLLAAREMTPQDALAVRERRIARGTWDDPGILVLLARRGGHMIVDGNHRAAARKMLGEDSMRFYEFHEDDLGTDCLRNPDLDMVRKYTVPNASATGMI